MNNIQKTPEQQIEEVVESLKALFLPQARNKQEADEIKRRLDSLGHEAKAVSARVCKINCVTQYFQFKTHRSGNAQRQGAGPPVPTSDKIRTT